MQDAWLEPSYCPQIADSRSAGHRVTSATARLARWHSRQHSFRPCPLVSNCVRRYSLCAAGQTLVDWNTLEASGVAPGWDNRLDYKSVKSIACIELFVGL